MKCPICGSKMKMEFCSYCKIEAKQIVFASNKLAKEKIKKRDKSDVYISSVKPFDVDRYKLLFLTLFLGWMGASSYLVGRYRRGLFFSLSIFFGFVFSTIKGISIENNWSNFFLQLCFEISLLFCVIALVMWLNDIVRVISGKFKIPVVLADKDMIVEGEINE